MPTQSIYRIFVILAGNKAFIGKTTSDDTQPILWRHLRGEYKTTRNHFTRDSADKPRIVVLKEIQTSHRTAYRFTVAFIRLFMDAGYQILNSNGMIEDACEIYKPTQSILDSLKTVPLDWYLQPKAETLPAKPAAPITKSPCSPTRSQSRKQELATEKITLRATPTEKKQFTDLAKQSGVTQRQMLMLLMVNYQSSRQHDADCSSEAYARSMLKTYQEANAALKEENELLKARLAETKAADLESPNSGGQKLRGSVPAYFHQFESKLHGNEPLQQGTCSDYWEETSPEQFCRNPNTEAGLSDSIDTIGDTADPPDSFDPSCEKLTQDGSVDQLIRQAQIRSRNGRFS